MSTHLAFCIWHTNTTCDTPWIKEGRPHIYGSIRSSPESVLHADALLGTGGFDAAKRGALTNGPGKTLGYYVQPVVLERAS